MANKFTRFLRGAAGGLTTPKGQMANWQHATRIFVDNTYRLSPRTKFLFYVHFEIDSSVHKAPAFTKQADEVGLLVKTSDLPKFSFDTETKHQYNRKKIIYKQINYDPVNITFHDDSAGIINALWAIYYGYYIADRSNPSSAYGATQYRNKNANNSFRYGLDNNISEPFFKSVSIYTMSRRRFQGYTLVNPKIKSWTHGDVSYASGNETVESSMQLEYEAVRYSAGNVNYDSPKGFASLHYDTLPSPLSVAGGGVSNLSGPGGVLDGLESIFGDVSTGAAFESPGAFLSTAIRSINTYRNFKGLSKDSLKQEAINILSNPAAIATAVSTVGGVVGAVFPKSTGTVEPTNAAPKRLAPNASGGTQA
jgi:hypothetical protein